MFNLTRGRTTNPYCLYNPLHFQATYVTSLFPYVILVILFGRGITLEGASEGIIYYLKPDWNRVASATVSLFKEFLKVLT